VDEAEQAAGMTTQPRLRLAPGRTVLWRGDRTVQLGVDPRHAVVVDGLSAGLARTLRLLDELAGAGLVEPADRADHPPPPLAADAAAWGLRTGRRAGELLARRAMATVQVHGNGRIAVAVATLLAAAGVGAVAVHATGRVADTDVGTGYLPRDVGQPRERAAAEAVYRSRTVATADVPPELPDVAVLADHAAWDPHLALRLSADRVPHLAVHAREASAVVGPLVLPGRTSCLHCADLHRTDGDPCWPRVAAQLAALPPAVELACAHVAAGMAAEQVLALLTGRGEAADEPPAAGTTFEVDPLHGSLVRRRWPPHPRCGCGAGRDDSRGGGSGDGSDDGSGDSRGDGPSGGAGHGASGNAFDDQA
jgi:bacteriocin biosynthesis cyclodehydratase domain-containing protein